MKNTILILFAIVIASCKTPVKEEVSKQVGTQYPENLAKVLEHHGGINSWKQKKTLSFEINNENHTVDLATRKTRVSSENYTLGYDGKQVWLTQKDTTSFKGNPEFYYNLYFYFYAMPFVLADDGIVYSETKPLVFEGVSYPGIKISYKANIGTSPDDNYFIYYHPETYQMEWLGYTVTYFSKKPSTKFNIIRYNDWENINGVVLPKSITWYQKNEDGNPTEPSKDPVVFSNSTVSEEGKPDAFYDKLTE